MRFTIRKLLIAMAAIGLVLFVGQWIVASHRRIEVKRLVQYAGGEFCWDLANRTPSVDRHTDPWGRKLKAVQVNERGAVFVWSIGPDGRDGTHDDCWYFSEGNFKGAREEAGYGPRPDWTYVQQTAR